jgi:hypothetical protein
MAVSWEAIIMERLGGMRRVCSLGAAAIVPVLLMFAAVSPGPATAQQAVAIDPGRDCQTILTCNYSRRGSFRGCLSSYTCRVCRPQRVRCSASDISSGRRQCTELVCTWGG